MQSQRLREIALVFSSLEERAFRSPNKSVANLNVLTLFSVMLSLAAFNLFQCGHGQEDKNHQGLLASKEVQGITISLSGFLFRLLIYRRGDLRNSRI